MDDLISRKALLAEYDRVHIGEPGKARKLIEDAPRVDAVELPHWATETAYKNGYAQGVKDAVKWISVKDRLPAVGEDVLVITSSSDRNMAVWRLFGNAENRQAHWEDEVGDGLVLGAATHWMPLPQPPKGE